MWATDDRKTWPIWHVPGLFGLARMERQLSALFCGRKVDMRTPEDLSRLFRQEVVSSAEVQYAE